MQPFSLLIKPTGSDCNLDCCYCFYKDKTTSVARQKQRMSDEVLEKLIIDYLKLPLAEPAFAWQGGEPTLMGLDFYEKVIQLQKKYRQPDQQINTSLQTNAILLDRKWARFLHDNKFLVGLSIDGPGELHDYYRMDKSGSRTFDKVMQAVENCKIHNVDFNVLVLLNNKNVEHPDRLFDFFIDNIEDLWSALAFGHKASLNPNSS